MRTRVVIVAYLYAQAVLIVLWWLFVLAVPSARPLFWPTATPAFVIAAFTVPDVLLLATLSAVAGWLVSRSHRRAEPALWLVVGAIAYPTCYCMASMLVTGEAAVGALAMLVACGSTVATAVAYGWEACC